MFFEKMQTRKNDGFTLVELIVVIAILAILAGIGVPAYSGYVEKANMAADQQLAYDVANALQLYYYNNYSDETAPKSGYVILSTDASPAFSTGMDTAMNDVFGADGWASLRLKSSDWNPALTKSVAGSSGAASVGSSSYLTNSTVPELLDNVQTVTSAAAGLLGTVAKTETAYVNALQEALGENYLKDATKAGIMTYDEATGKYGLVGATPNGDNIKVEGDLQNQLANMMVLSVSKELDGASEADMQALMLSGFETSSTEKEYSQAAKLAAQYALYKAYALDNNKSADFDTLNANLAKAEGIADVTSAFSGFLTDENVQGLDAYLSAYDENDNYTGYSDIFTNNANSISAIMSGVSSVSGDYANAESLKDAALFTSGAVSDQLDTYVNAASIAGSLSGVTVPANGIVVLLGSNGSVSIDS